MQLSYLEEIPKELQKVLVIGKTIERDGQRYHIVGMTSGHALKLHIIEPYQEKEHSLPGRRRSDRQRSLLKEQTDREFTYLHCSEFRLGDKRIKMQGGNGSPLKYSEQDYRTVTLFIDMMRAGWNPPDWLKEKDWNDLQLITLTAANLKRLPKYTPEMPITITHRPDSVRHLLEKSVTLTAGKPRSLCFKDHVGDEVWCHLNQVTLIDVWKDTERQLNDPRYIRKVTPKQLQEMKDHFRKALEESCPEGMCYIGIEYECSKDYSLQFYSREYLSSRPESNRRSATFLLMHMKPDQKTGIHGLPLRGCVIQTPVSPDTVKIPAELFCYYEKIEAWEESV